MTSELWSAMRFAAVIAWISLRALHFRRELQAFLNLGKSREIRDRVAAGMIDAIHRNRGNPGAEMGKLRFPNAMYAVGQQVFEVCLQLAIPAVLVGCVFAGMATLRGDGAAEWARHRLAAWGLPLSEGSAAASRLVTLSRDVVRRAFPSGRRGGE